MATPKLGKSADEIWDYVFNSNQRIDLDTCGDGIYFLDKGKVLHRKIDQILMREATEQEKNDLHKWLDRDMIKVIEYVGSRPFTIYEPSGFGFR